MEPENAEKSDAWMGSDGSSESYDEHFEPACGREPSAGEEEGSYREDESGKSTTDSDVLTAPPESLVGQIPRPRSRSSSSSSLGRAADMTLALTLTAGKPRGVGDRRTPGVGNGRVGSSKEGGSSEAPPARVFFGISDEGAEQAERWNSESDTDLCRRDGHGTRCARLSHKESQSERRVKETKSKCKRIARLLTDAPNPRNKGALLFKKRRQRVEKYTLVSYGTGDSNLDSEDQFEEEAEEVRAAGYDFVTSDSELEEEYSVYRRQNRLYWESVGEMDALPDTKGKGVLMFAQRRKRMDEITAQHEELAGKGSPVETERRETPGTYNSNETYTHTDQANYLDANIQQAYLPSDAPRPFVPNRTAKPFLRFQVRAVAPPVPGGSPATKKPETRFKVPVPINTNPQVWSPTGDIIASRDERISVPAIKTGILPEPKRKGGNREKPPTKHESERLMKKGDRRSYIEPEEDCFSLGAEACNFMQPRPIKLKNPPPVAPKPAFNPMTPPWMRGPSGEPILPPRSPVSQPPLGPARPHDQHERMANRWAPDQAQATRQTVAGDWAPLGTTAEPHLQPAPNSWSQPLPRSPVSMQARSPSYSPTRPPSSSRNISDSGPNSFASCPPQAGLSDIHASKALQVSQKVRVPNRGVSQGAESQTITGKGAELLAKRQSGMEKLDVGREPARPPKTRVPSPTSSLPISWRYSSNVRAPPPVAYNPLLSPFYPVSAGKQAPSSSIQKSKTKPKAPPKHLSPLDIMKHQPYKLDSSLFSYDAATEVKNPSAKQTLPSKFEVMKNIKQQFGPSPYEVAEIDFNRKPEAPARSSGSVSSQTSSVRQNTRPAESLAVDKHWDEKHTVKPASHQTGSKQAPGIRPGSTSSQRSSTDDSIASAFSPASLIARGVRQMAPRPKFSAKKSVVSTKQWRPIAILN